MRCSLITDKKVKEFMKWVAREGKNLRPQVDIAAEGAGADAEGWMAVKRLKNGEDEF